MKGFWDRVSAVTYGDDNVINVAETHVKAYNQITVADAMMREFGITYTPGRKDGVWFESMPLSDVTFLKRRFYFEDGHVNAPLELDSMLYTLYWCKNRREESKIIADSLENMLEELSLHEPALWDRYAPRILERIVQRGLVPRACPTRAGYLACVRKRSDYY